jgi:DNA-binding NarL/FixJ family response regulator
MRDKVTDAEVSAAWSENGKKNTDVLAANAAKLKGKTHKVRRTLRAQEMAGHGLRVYEARDPESVAAMRAGFRERMTSPEARAKWEESMRRANADRVYTPEQRAAASSRLQSAEAQAKRDAYNAARRQDECMVDGCDNPHLARSYCIKHYRRWKLYGDPLGRGKVGKPTALSVEQEQQALKMLATGKSQREVGEYFGCSQTAIGRMVKRHKNRP